MAKWRNLYTPGIVVGGILNNGEEVNSYWLANYLNQLETDKAELIKALAGILDSLATEDWSYARQLIARVKGDKE